MPENNLESLVKNDPTTTVAPPDPEKLQKIQKQSGYLSSLLGLTGGSGAGYAAYGLALPYMGAAIAAAPAVAAGFTGFVLAKGVSQVILPFARKEGRKHFKYVLNQKRNADKMKNNENVYSMPGSQGYGPIEKAA